MTASSRQRPSKGDSSSSPGDVAAFLGALDHPHKPEILALPALILEADPSVGESIKSNAPSFYTSQHFATFQLRAQPGVQVVLHFGARPGPNVAARDAIADPESLRQWKSPDRAIVTFRDLEEIRQRESAFTHLLRQWITFFAGSEAAD